MFPDFKELRRALWQHLVYRKVWCRDCDSFCRNRWFGAPLANRKHTNLTGKWIKAILTRALLVLISYTSRDVRLKSPHPEFCLSFERCECACGFYFLLFDGDESYPLAPITPHALCVFCHKVRFSASDSPSNWQWQKVSPNSANWSYVCSGCDLVKCFSTQMMYIRTAAWNLGERISLCSCQGWEPFVGLNGILFLEESDLSWPWASARMRELLAHGEKNKTDSV